MPLMAPVTGNGGPAEEKADGGEWEMDRDN